MAYWVLSLGLIGFGFVAAFSIGLPFVMVGGTMLMLGQVRHRPRLYWPPFAAVVAFNVGYWAIAPFSCIATQTVGGVSTTVCTNLLGGSTSGTGSYSPSLGPATEAGVTLAAVVFVAVLGAIVLRGRRVNPRGSARPGR